MKKADGSFFRGECETSPEFTAANCNEKLIGARSYPEAFVATVPGPERDPNESLSPRDGDGHGSHTASTAAGNFGVPASVEGRSFGKISGMAPAAKIAAYKVCFNDTDPDTGGCYTSSTLDAVDDAITDGVDVINYSISGATEHGRRRRSSTPSSARPPPACSSPRLPATAARPPRPSRTTARG